MKKKIDAKKRLSNETGININLDEKVELNEKEYQKFKELWEKAFVSVFPTNKTKGEN